MTTTWGFTVSEHGGSEVLTWDRIELPELGPHDVLVTHKAIGLNFIDIYFREGLYPMSLPGRIGVEAAGVVSAVGDSVTLVNPGDRVAYCKGPLGSYAQHHILSQDCLIPLPDSINFELAAASLLKGLTAAYLLFKTAPQAQGKSILIQAAAGGVGSILSQWSKHLGCRVIGTVGSEEKAALALSQGCDDIIFYDREDVAARVRELTGGRGVDVVFDSVGAATWEGSLDALAKRGMFVTFGNASGPVPPIAPLILAKKGSLFLTRPGLADYIDDRSEMLELATLLFDVIASGVVKIPVSAQVPLAQAPQAQDALAERKTTGSTVLIP